MSQNKIEGVYTALPTPMTENHQINYDALEKHLDYLEENEVHGVVPAGCTGHAASLDFQEHIDYVTEVAEYTDLPVIPGDGINSTQQTINLAQEIEQKADIEAHLMISPYQNCPPQDLIVEHYKTIAEELEEDILAYNVPGRTGRNIEPETVEELAQIPGLIGIKEASNNPEQIKEIAERLENIESEFYLGSGDDPRNDLVYSEGGTFSITVSGNVAPKRSVDVWEEAKKGNYQEASRLNEELQPLHNAMFQEGEKNPIGVHYALEKLGFETGTPRAPLNRRPRQDDTYQNREEIEDVLEEMNLLN